MQELGRVLGLDIGDVRTGVAVSDPLQIIASPREVVPSASPDILLARVQELVRETEARTVVVGVPLDQHGNRGPQAEKVISFVERLRAVVDIPVVTQDERFSTAEAQRMLIAADVRRAKRKKVVDKVAAAHILQTYLDRLAADRRRSAGA